MQARREGTALSLLSADLLRAARLSPRPRPTIFDVVGVSRSHTSDHHDLRSPGTGGSPTIGAVSPLSLLGALNVPTLNASGTTLTITGTAVTLALGTPVSIQINGL